jgi:alpha-N-arabinofuranosidase
VGLAAARSARAADARIEVLAAETIGTIAPEVFGHFTEHIGGVIYDGIWVGEDSKIPNIGGIRKQLVDALKPLKPAVVRWPGGCFADSYNWRDGIGPRAKRPRRTNIWIMKDDLANAPDGPQKYEPNWFGTHEFVRFARLVGAEPYLAANLRSLPAESFYEWLEYCNAPAGATTLAEERGANGDRDPMHVRYWGVGNESWGCGGDLTPAEYATAFRRYTSFLPDYGVGLKLVASGPNGGDVEWTRRFFAGLLEKGRPILRRVWGWALHYYCGTSGAGQALNFTTDDWYELLGKADRMDGLIRQHWTAMEEAGVAGKVKLVVDEWGAWHNAGSEVDPRYLFGQTPTLRDALISGITLDTFNRHADKIAMANAAQLINNLHALFLAREEKFTVTPNYHVFRMYLPHAGARSVRTLFSAPALNYRNAGALTQMWGLGGSASIQGNRLVLTAVNPHATRACAAEIAVRGAKLGASRATVLASTDLKAHNSFEHPDALRPVESAAELKAGVYTFAPASVTRLEFELQ